MVGAFLAPMAAGTQAANQGWRWSYYTLAICLSILTVLFAVGFEETKYIPITIGQTDVIDDASERPESKDDIDEKTKIENEVSKVATRTSITIPMNTWRQRLRFTTTTNESLAELFMMPLHVITLPHVMFTALQFASGVCWLVVFMQVTSIVFSAPPYLFTTAGVGYMALGPFIGNIFGSIYGGPFADWAIVRLARRNGGFFEPEMRLYPLVIPTIFMAGGIIMFGVTADRVSNSTFTTFFNVLTFSGHALDLSLHRRRILRLRSRRQRRHDLHPRNRHIPRTHSRSFYWHRLHAQRHLRRHSLRYRSMDEHDGSFQHVHSKWNDCFCYWLSFHSNDYLG